uniref:Uncharacterized protein n=1 Tax=Oryza glaberrima TaxID=4538 RepID=I1R517_ORYGL
MVGRRAREASRSLGGSPSLKQPAVAHPLVVADLKASLLLTVQYNATTTVAIVTAWATDEEEDSGAEVRKMVEIL